MGTLKIWRTKVLATYVCGYHGTMRSSGKVFTCEKEPGNATHSAGAEPIMLPGVTS